MTRLPGWVERGGFVLALAAGAVNAIAILGFNHQGVSHLSGLSTLLGIEASAGHAALALNLALGLAAFVAGAAISGFLIGGEPFKLSKTYTTALLIETFLLLLAMVMLEQHAGLGHVLASIACGLQNAMTSTFSSAIVRTTHVTGLFTDLGVALGLRLRGQPADKRRVWLNLALISGFILGGTAGAIGFDLFQFGAFYLPAALTLFLGATSLVLIGRDAGVDKGER